MYWTEGPRKGEPKELWELDEDMRLALRGYKKDANGNVEFKFREKTAAREQAFKHFGLYERDNEQKPFYSPPQIVIVGVPGRRSEEDSGPAIPFVVEGRSSFHFGRSSSMCRPCAVFTFIHSGSATPHTYPNAAELTLRAGAWRGKPFAYWLRILPVAVGGKTL